MGRGSKTQLQVAGSRDTISAVGVVSMSGHFQVRIKLIQIHVHQFLCGRIFAYKRNPNQDEFKQDNLAGKGLLYRY